MQLLNRGWILGSFPALLLNQNPKALEQAKIRHEKLLPKVIWLTAM